jgi:hypothetical protein
MSVYVKKQKGRTYIKISYTSLINTIETNTAKMALTISGLVC